MKIIISLPIISANKLLRMHWAKRAKIQDGYYWALIFATKHWQREGSHRKWKVIITSYRKRLLDKDNLYSGVKPLCDSLKKAGLIWDDAPKWLDLDVRQVVDGKNQRTEIEIN
jgi:Holliday junction resolvase RusA-like endonuclease